MAERLRHRVTTLMLLPQLATLAGPPFSLICSIGAWLHSAHAGTSGELISAADAAVYGAKRAGKNCACMAERTNQQTGNGRVMIHAAPWRISFSMRAPDFCKTHSPLVGFKEPMLRFLAYGTASASCYKVVSGDPLFDTDTIPV